MMSTILSLREYVYQLRRKSITILSGMCYDFKTLYYFDYWVLLYCLTNLLLVGLKIRATRTTKTVKDFNWARVLSMDPEKIVRAASLSQKSVSGKNTTESRQSPVIANPTPAMLQILSKRKENIRSSFKSKVLLPTEVRWGTCNFPNRLLKIIPFW